MTTVSIIVPCRNEKDYIEAFLASIAMQDYPSKFIEIILVDGMSNDGTYRLVEKLEIPNLKLLQNEKKYVSNALNLAINNSTGHVILRMDVHCNYPINYVRELVNYIINNPNVGSVGGRSVTLPGNDTFDAKIIALAGSTRFGVGNSIFRISKTDEIIQADTVPLGCWRRSIFDIVGYFDTDLIRNQDDEFHQRLISHGFEIHLMGSLKIDYFARKTLTSNSWMYFQYGLFKPSVNKKLSKVTTLRQLAPLLLLIYLASVIIGSLLFPHFSLIAFMIIILLYLGASFFTLMSSELQLSIKAVVLLAFIVFLMHLSYGIGYVLGSIYMPRKLALTR